MAKTVYSVFLGLLLAIFINASLEYYYGFPSNPPNYPSGVSSIYDSEMTADQRAAISQYDNEMQSYTEKTENFYHDSTMLSVIAATILVLIGILLIKQVGTIANGLLLGGAFSLYGIGRLTNQYISGVDLPTYLSIVGCVIVSLGIGFAKIEEVKLNMAIFKHRTAS